MANRTGTLEMDEAVPAHATGYWADWHVEILAAEAKVVESRHNTTHAAWPLETKYTLA